MIAIFAESPVQGRDYKKSENLPENTMIITPDTPDFRIRGNSFTEIRWLTICRDLEKKAALMICLNRQQIKAQIPAQPQEQSASEIIKSLQKAVDDLTRRVSALEMSDLQHNGVLR